MKFEHLSRVNHQIVGSGKSAFDIEKIDKSVLELKIIYDVCPSLTSVGQQMASEILNWHVTTHITYLLLKLIIFIDSQLCGIEEWREDLEAWITYGWWEGEGLRGVGRGCFTRAEGDQRQRGRRKGEEREERL